MNRRLFLIFFKIGLFTLGGGPAMIPIVQAEIVEQKKLISEQDFLDSVAFSSGLPGAIIVNLSVFVGNRINGFLGAIFSALGAILPAYLAIVLLAAIFDIVSGSAIIQSVFLGIRPTVIVLIGSSIYSIIRQTKYDRAAIAIAAVALAAMLALELSAFVILLLAGVFGLIFYSQKRYENAP